MEGWDWKGIFASCPTFKETWNTDFCALYHRYIHAATTRAQHELDCYNNLLKPLVEFVEHFNEVATTTVKVIVQETFLPMRIPRTIHRISDNHAPQGTILAANGIVFIQTTQPSDMKKVACEWKAQVALNMGIHASILNAVGCSVSDDITICSPLMSIVDCLGFRFLAIAPVRELLDSQSPSFVKVAAKAMEWMDINLSQVGYISSAVLVDRNETAWIVSQPSSWPGPTKLSVQAAVDDILKSKDYPIDQIPWYNTLHKCSLRMRDLGLVRAAIPLEYAHMRTAALIEMVARTAKGILRKRCQRGGLSAVSDVLNKLLQIDSTTDATPTFFLNALAEREPVSSATIIYKEFADDKALLAGLPLPLVLHQIAQMCSICFSNEFWESFYYSPKGQFAQFSDTDIHIVVVSRCAVSLEHDEGHMLTRILGSKKKELNHTDWMALSSKALSLLRFHCEKYPDDIQGWVSLGQAYMQRSQYCTPSPKQMVRAQVHACEAFENASQLDINSPQANIRSNIPLLLGMCVCEMGLVFYPPGVEDSPQVTEGFKFLEYGISQLARGIDERYSQHSVTGADASFWLSHYIQLMIDKVGPVLPSHFREALNEIEQTRALSEQTLLQLRCSTMKQFSFSRREGELTKYKTSIYITFHNQYSLSPPPPSNRHHYHNT